MDIARILRFIIRSQQWLCRSFDHLLPVSFRIDGNHDFQTYVAGHVKAGLVVYDVGGGKRPFFSPERKQQLSLHICGLDIDGDQLRQAPTGAYDEILTADIAEYRGAGDADLVICQAVLEHVANTARAVEAIASLLKPGGKALLFLPCSHALFARINRALPERLKRAILFTLFPDTQCSQGFPSYYDRCTPADFRQFAAANHLVCDDLTSYYMSAYMSFAFPLHVIWRLVSVLRCFLFREQACETFSVVLRKHSSSELADHVPSSPSSMRRHQGLIAGPMPMAKESAPVI